MLSAAFGVGGAVVSTPGIRLLGASATVAVGTTLPSILPSAVSGTLRYVREGLVDWHVARWAAPAGVVASIGGSLLSRAVPGEGHVLMLLTAALLAVTSWRMGTVPGPAAEDVEPSPEDDRAVADDRPDGGPPRGGALATAAMGATAGGLSGLLGVGGGVVLVPAFTEILRLPIKHAIATSLVCVGIFAVPGTITHTLLGGVDWRFAIALAVAVIPGARLGAHLAVKAHDRRLRRSVALFLGVIALVFGAGEIASLAND